MRFLVDVNASGVVAHWLKERGHNVREVANTDPGMDDARILAWAVAEDRVIVTTDQDFEELIWREGKQHSGLLRLENLPRAERIGLLADVLEHYHRELQSGAIVIASRNKIRIRKR